MIKKKCDKAQVSLEFAFCMIAILLLIYGSVMIFRWAGLSMAERRIAHEGVLLTAVSDGYSEHLHQPTPLSQVSLEFYTPRDMNFVFRGW